MTREEIKRDILKRLSANVSPKLLDYHNDIDNYEYQEILAELIDEGLITARIDNGNPPFGGDYEKVKLIK